MQYQNIPPGSSKYLNYNYVWNSFWLIVVTMSTVGFGDLYPLTHFGRFVIVIACFWGMFLVSQFIYTMETVSKFTPQETNVFDLLQRLQRRAQLKVEAANLISAWWKLKKGTVKFKPKHNLH